MTLKKKLKQIFLTGLAVIIPAGLTLYILFFLIDIMDGLLKIMPAKYHPDALFGVHIPGLGIIVTVALIFICGLVTTSYLGHKIVQSGEDIVDRIPFVRNIYQAIKRISDSMIIDRRTSFKTVVMVEFPRKGLYTIGFVTGVPGWEIQKKTGKDCSSVFLPTTPNPTSGYLIIVPDDEIVALDISVEEALTYIISVGIVTPSHRAKMKEKLEPEEGLSNGLKSVE